MSKKGFVILSAQRSGSTFLVSLLNNHPDIICTGEIFKRVNPLNIIQPDFSYQHLKSKSLKNQLQHYLRNEKSIHEHLDNIYRNREEYLGFKLMPIQIKRFPSTLQYIYDNKIPILYLYRANFLERYVSIKVASKTKAYSSRKTVRLKNIHLDPQKIVADLTKMQNELDLLRAYASKADKNMELSFEELTKTNPTKSVEKILSFIGVTQSDSLQSEMKKMVKKPLSEMIENYSEIKDVLIHSTFKQFLPE